MYYDSSVCTSLHKFPTNCLLIVIACCCGCKFAVLYGSNHTNIATCLMYKLSQYKMAEGSEQVDAHRLLTNEK